ncbi:cation diffusion facilitator family transporter [Myroides pelagicus]|uniref:Cation diffusion facilitator family transporter n=1 Tax=Myroides pelagicus TaxID=270914 RepID=A0A7K1GMU0_9FLAO|nr:cation diffusion facilitator family transporter [Myroides pelagicus]MEC4114573.1 cation diffusion facilitator family transporter [Myroides pelagicus]MTH30197.1 cation diffusion facilitator family transporter [Myroides pelagicus]
MNTKARENFQFQKVVAIVGVLLFIIKVVAWSMTHSVAILTDALESVINVVSGFVGLYSLYLSSLPRDRNHPYGHGKVEFISATIEGGLIIMAGIVIIFEAIKNFVHPETVGKLDYGILLVAFTAIVNYILGWYAVKQGRTNNSLALVASGKHLQSDTYSTIGIIIGLILMYFTGYQWLDGAVALLFALIIIVTGYKIVRGAISGIMDETDELLLEEVVGFLQEYRQDNWIDLHNLRIIKYGSVLHFDCHMTIPWYFNIVEGHKEVEILEKGFSDRFGDDLELFVHMDDCKPFSCKICAKSDCPFRNDPFEKQVVWTMDNIVKNKRHTSITPSE